MKSQKLKSILSITFTFFWATIIFCQTAKCQNLPSVTADTKASIDSFIEKKMNETGMVGIGAAIILNKKLIWMKEYGYADKENKIPFTPNTIMNIGSISKTFTGETATSS
jgi:CubicO group peptidase (beta-lactamase class C family)